MSKTKHKQQTEFAYPVGRICGKISRHSNVIHSCTAKGKSITYLQGTRDLEAHPISPEELAAKSLFARRAAAVGARVDSKASTYAADMAAYRTQLKEAENPIEGFRAYIWSLVKQEITE